MSISHSFYSRYPLLLLWHKVNRMKSKLLVVTSLIALGMVTRFIPHPYNFTAIGAVALFGGAMYKDSWKAILIPILALFISDLLINNVMYAQYYGSFTLFTDGFYYVYIGFALTALIGRYAIKSFKPSSIFGAGVTSAILFYLVTNFNFWLTDPLYPKNFLGLMESYTAGLPFLGNQILGNVFYSALLFGIAWYSIGSRKAELIKA